MRKPSAGKRESVRNGPASGPAVWTQVKEERAVAEALADIGGASFSSGAALLFVLHRGTVCFLLDSLWGKIILHL